MLEICTLGTGAMMPLPGRRLASLLVRREGRLLLIDCGEGTQVAIRESGLSLARIDIICLTHFHADHVAGLPGLLLTMGTCGRTQPVRLMGPIGLASMVHSLCVIAPELAFPLELEEITAPEYHTVFQDMELTAFALSHILPCYGYSLTLKRPGKFDPVRAQALGIPRAYWRALQQSQTVETPAGRFVPSQVLGSPRKGLKLTYCTDTRPVEAITLHAYGSDLFLCEGTYPEESQREKAAQYGHMTFGDAARLARQAQVQALWLTHFSPSIADPASFLPAAQAVFPNTFAAEDLRFKQLSFPEESQP